MGHLFISCKLQGLCYKIDSSNQFHNGLVSIDRVKWIFGDYTTEWNKNFQGKLLFHSLSPNQDWTVFFTSLHGIGWNIYKVGHPVTQVVLSYMWIMAIRYDFHRAEPNAHYQCNVHDYCCARAHILLLGIFPSQNAYVLNWIH